MTFVLAGAQQHKQWFFSKEVILSAILLAAALASLLVVGVPRLGCEPATVIAAHTSAAEASSPVQGYVPRPLPWEPLLTAAQMRRGLAHYGSGVLIEQLVAKLVAGQPVTAVVVGGSVSTGWRASNYEKSYVPLFFKYLNSSFPHREHAFYNKAIRASSASIYAACAEFIVPQAADLVIVELTINERVDAPFTSADRRSFEQLLRKLSRLPHSPAVIVLHQFPWWTAHDDMPDGPFYHTAEVQLSVLAQYYDVPSLSLRNAAYDALRGACAAPIEADQTSDAQEMVMGANRVPTPQVNKVPCYKQVYHDEVHPKDIGHQLLAELLAGLIQMIAGHSVAMVSQPGPVVAAEATGPAMVAMPSMNISANALRPPMIHTLVDSPTSVCAIQEGFKSVVSAAQGFIYKAERPNATTFSDQKWGFVSEHPGDWLELLVNTEASPGSHGKAMVHLGFLMSYEHMGQATAQCRSGCECKDQQLEAAWDRQASLMQTYTFEVTQHPQCLLRVTISPRPEVEVKAGKGNKFQVSAIIVGHMDWRLYYNLEQLEDLASIG